jgi:phytoene synthase
MMFSLADRDAESQEIWRRFRHHSRTFSLAALFLPQRIRMPVATLYLFCRSVDEIADRVVLDRGHVEALAQLEGIQRDLAATMDRRAPGTTLWRRLSEVHFEFELNPKPMHELIDGARWDLEGRGIEDEQDLIRYSDLVGGSIGAMMLPLLGLAGDSRIEKRARDLGIGMQITNIVRDVGEDLRVLGRSYLPQSLSAQYKVDPLAPRPADDEYRRLMEHLMEMAEGYYRSGIAGVEALPPAVRPGIRAASTLYREILNEVRTNRYDNVSRRAYTSAFRKALSLTPRHYERRKRRLTS